MKQVPTISDTQTDNAEAQGAVLSEEWRKAAAAALVWLEKNGIPLNSRRCLEHELIILRYVIAGGNIYQAGMKTGRNNSVAYSYARGVLVRLGVNVKDRPVHKARPPGSKVKKQEAHEASENENVTARAPIPDFSRMIPARLCSEDQNYLAALILGLHACLEKQGTRIITDPRIKWTGCQLKNYSSTINAAIGLQDAMGSIGVLVRVDDHDQRHWKLSSAFVQRYNDPEGKLIEWARQYRAGRRKEFNAQYRVDRNGKLVPRG